LMSSFWNLHSPRMRRITVIVLVFLLTLLVTIAGTLTPLSSQDANQINQELDQVRQNISVQNIFGNNLMICLIMFIPIIGPIFGFAVLYNTGVAISAQSMLPAAQGVPAAVLLLALFIFPFTWMEFISYSTGLAESVWLIRRFMTHNGRREIKNAAILIAIVAVILLAAAAIETALILYMGS
jgi:Stage II sporulation protein M